MDRLTRHCLYMGIFIALWLVIMLIGTYCPAFAGDDTTKAILEVKEVLKSIGDALKDKVATHTEGKGKSIAGVVWDKEGNILYQDMGIRYVNPGIYECLTEKDYGDYGRPAIRLTLHYSAGRSEEKAVRDDIKRLSREKTEFAKERVEKLKADLRDLEMRTLLKKRRFPELFQEARKCLLSQKELSEKHVLLTTMVIFSDPAKDIVMLWFEYVPESCWKCKAE